MSDRLIAPLIAGGTTGLATALSTATSGISDAQVDATAALAAATVAQIAADAAQATADMKADEPRGNDRLYQATFPGRNGAGAVALVAKTNDVTPAVGDIIVYLVDNDNPVVMYQIGDDFGVALIDSSGAKVQQINAADWTTKQFNALLRKVV